MSLSTPILTCAAAGAAANDNMAARSASFLPLMRSSLTLIVAISDQQDPIGLQLTLDVVALRLRSYSIPLGQDR
jgi:hypothetical protein